MQDKSVLEIPYFHAKHSRHEQPLTLGGGGVAKIQREAHRDDVTITNVNILGSLTYLYSGALFIKDVLGSNLSTVERLHTLQMQNCISIVGLCICSALESALCREVISMVSFTWSVMEVPLHCVEKMKVLNNTLNDVHIHT